MISEQCEPADLARFDALHSSSSFDSFVFLFVTLWPNPKHLPQISEELRVISEQCEPVDLARFDSLRSRFRPRRN